MSDLRPDSARVLEFLVELLNTPSPTGYCAEAIACVQRGWTCEVRPVSRIILSSANHISLDQVYGILDDSYRPRHGTDTMPARSPRR